MKIVEKTIAGKKINKIVELFIYLACYGLVIMLVALIMGKPHFSFSEELFYLWPFLASIVIYALNRTVKPLIFKLTLPITGITLGLFYPFINVFILYLTSYLMGDKFIVEGVFTIFVIAILISLMNIILEIIVIKPIIRRSDKR